MSDMDALQGRIMVALDRIGAGLDALGGASGDEVEALRQALEDERLANAQLQERVRHLNERTREAEEEARTAGYGAEQERKRHAEALRRTDADLQSLRLANQQLRDSNAALREANASGVVEPHLINKAMMAELEALRAARAADRAEIDLVLGELGSLVDSAEPPQAAQKEDV